jgi:predicted alpha/beta hydrolase family esterase
MRNIIIVHAVPDSKEEYEKNGIFKHWLPWIKGTLEQKGIAVVIPEMPTPYAPIYEQWKEVFEQFPLTEETTLIGHSYGAGFLLRYLSENNISVGKVVLVAPWIDPEGYLATLSLPNSFDFIPDANLAERTDSVTVFYSTDDDDNILESVRQIKATYTGFDYKAFTDRGHFTTEPGYDNDTFPELIDLVTN